MPSGNESATATPIVAGTFDVQGQARSAAAALEREGFARQDVTTFFVNPPGRHATYPLGGDRDVSPGAGGADRGAVKGALIGLLADTALGIAAWIVVG